MSPKYHALMTKVLVSNYWGEVLLGEAMGVLVARDVDAKWTSELTRIMLDEARHASLVRSLLIARGVDPDPRDERGSFPFAGLFEKAEPTTNELLLLLDEFERQSAPTFERLVRTARREGDADVLRIYEEIIRDEARHTKVFDRFVLELPDIDSRARERVRQGLEKVMNWDYFRLYAAFPTAPKRGPA